MKIKEITKLFGITPDTVRFYEDKGLIHPKRDKNGYREYSIWDVMALSDCMKYKGFGLSLDEIKHITEENTPGYYSEILKKQIRNTKEELLKKQQLLDNLESYLKHLEFARMNVGQYWYQAEPERKLCVLARVRISDINHNDPALAQWIKNIKNLKAFVLLPTRRAQKGNHNYIWCYGTEKSVADSINLPEGEDTIDLPARTYLHTIIDTPDGPVAFNEKMEQVFADLESKKLSVKGDILCGLVERYLENESWHSLIDMMIPVEKMN